MSRLSRTIQVGGGHYPFRMVLKIVSMCFREWRPHINKPVAFYAFLKSASPLGISGGVRYAFCLLLLACCYGQGNVGIGIASPTERLHVAGNLRLDNAFMPGNDPGSSGQVLLSKGPNTPPVWRSYGWTLWHVDAWTPTTSTTLGWSGSNNYDCGTSFRMYGGQGCGSGCAPAKTFTNLPPHSEVFVEVYVVTLDSWDQAHFHGLDHVAVEIDNTTHGKSYVGGFNPANQGSGVCAIYSHRDLGPYVCVAYAPHVNSSITIRVRANVSADDGGYSDEYLGIVAAKLYLR